MAATNLNLQSAGANNALREITPLVDIPSGWAWLWWIAAALAVAALAFWAWRYRTKRRAEAPPVPVIPAHVRARLKPLSSNYRLGSRRRHHDQICAANRVLDAYDGRRYLVIDREQLGRIARLGFRRGNDDSDALADIAHALDG